jgi:hypothetical protein
MQIMRLRYHMFLPQMPKTSPVASGFHQVQTVSSLNLRTLPAAHFLFQIFVQVLGRLDPAFTHFS